MKDDFSQSDPFRCDECKELGYCKRAKGEVETSLRVANIPINFGIAQILDNALPLKTTLVKRGTALSGQMQKAHDALRQNDYETASLHYKIIVSDGYYHWEAFLGLSLYSFYTEEYERAAKYAQQILVGSNSEWLSAITDFSQACMNKAEQQKLERDRTGKDSVTYLNTHLLLEI